MSKQQIPRSVTKHRGDDDIQGFLHDLPTDYAFAMELGDIGRALMTGDSHEEKLSNAADKLRIQITLIDSSMHTRVFGAAGLEGMAMTIYEESDNTCFLLYKKVRSEELIKTKAHLLDLLLQEKRFEATLLKQLAAKEQLNEESVFSYDQIFETCHKLDQLSTRVKHQPSKLAELISDYYRKAVFSLLRNKLPLKKQLATAYAQYCQGRGGVALPVGILPRYCVMCFRNMELNSLQHFRCGHDLCAGCITKARDLIAKAALPFVPMCPVSSCRYVLTAFEQERAGYSALSLQFSECVKVSLVF